MSGLNGARGSVAKMISIEDVLTDIFDEEDEAAEKAATKRAVTFSQVIKGYPEYRDDQPRGKDGKWSGGGGGSAPAKGREASRLYDRNTHKEGAISAPDFIKSLPKDQQSFLVNSRRKLERENQRLRTTEHRYREIKEDGSFGKWSQKRQRLHENIIRKYIEGAFEKGAYPDDGKPMVVLMGGRGGAGKTSTIEKFLGINPEKHPDFLYINSDDIKSQLPEYKGYNASLLHEESSHISDQIERIARDLGLNIIYDATLKSEASAVKRTEQYQDAGYRVEAFFVHTTPQTSARRAVARAVNSGRYVTPEYILSSTTNESTFDKVKGKANAWILFDNNGAAPKKVSSKGTSWLKSF